MNNRLKELLTKRGFVSEKAVVDAIMQSPYERLSVESYNKICGSQYKPGTFFVSERMHYQAFLFDEERQTFHQWFDRAIAGEIKRLSKDSSFSEKINKYGEGNLLNDSYEILFFSISSNIKFVDIILNQEYSDVFRRIILFLLYGDANYDIQSYTEFNALGYRLIPKVLERGKYTLKQRLCQSIYSGLIGMDIKDELAATSPLSREKIIPLQTSESFDEKIDRIFNRLDEATQDGRLAIDSWDSFETNIVNSNSVVALSWFTDDYIPTIFEMKFIEEVYMKLSPKFKVIISVYALIHDIGVIDGVQRHDLDGEKYVEQILEDLELTEEFWNQYSITFGEAIRILKVLVTNHTLINKISAEDSDRSIADRCTLIIKKLGNVAQSISLSDLATCYYLLGMADLIAVDDSLYTLKKYYLATNSYVYLESLFSGMPVARDLEQVALLRLGEMVNETTYSDIKNETKSILKQEDIDYHTFCEYLYQTYRLEYGTTYLKPLNSLKYTILSLYKLMSYVAKTFGTNKLSYLVIAFDATINFSKFKTAIEDGEYFYDIDTLSEQVLNVQSNNVSISYSTDTNRLSIATA